tara:strand:+ start:3265 stop:3645 length:381 start_codon:yes stop_codon:yes gene_type:complete
MALRSKETAEAYLKEQAGRDDFRNNKDYEEDHERILRSFEHWHIIENLYPYDNIAKEHHMLVPKRVFGRMSECTRDEWNEYKYLLNVFEEEGHYDCILENFSRGRSIIRHLHLHLIVYKDRYAGKE